MSEVEDDNYAYLDEMSESYIEAKLNGELEED